MRYKSTLLENVHRHTKHSDRPSVLRLKTRYGERARGEWQQPRDVRSRRHLGRSVLPPENDLVGRSVGSSSSTGFGELRGPTSCFFLVRSPRRLLTSKSSQCGRTSSHISSPRQKLLPTTGGRATGPAGFRRRPAGRGRSFQRTSTPEKRDAAGLFHASVASGSQIMYMYYLR